MNTRETPDTPEVRRQKRKTGSAVTSAHPEQEGDGKLNLWARERDSRKDELTGDRESHDEEDHGDREKGAEDQFRPMIVVTTGCTRVPTLQFLERLPLDVAVEIPPIISVRDVRILDQSALLETKTSEKREKGKGKRTENGIMDGMKRKPLDTAVAPSDSLSNEGESGKRKITSSRASDEGKSKMNGKEKRRRKEREEEDESQTVPSMGDTSGRQSGRSFIRLQSLTMNGCASTAGQNVQFDFSG